MRAPTMSRYPSYGVPAGMDVCSPRSTMSLSARAVELAVEGGQWSGERRGGGGALATGSPAAVAHSNTGDARAARSSADASHRLCPPSSVICR